MIASFNGNSRTTIIPGYSSIKANDETDIITFSTELFSLARRISKHSVLSVGGNMNVKIGEDETNKFCLHNSSNRSEHKNMCVFIYI